MTEQEQLVLLTVLEACRAALLILTDLSCDAQARITLATEGVQRLDEARKALLGPDASSPPLLQGDKDHVQA